MKILSILMIFGSFLVGAFLTSLDPLEVNWAWMTPVLLVGAVGLFIYRREVHREASHGERLSGNMRTLQSSLDNIVVKLEELDSGKMDLPVYEARFEIDRRFRDDLNAFADARESMIHSFGMQHYADVMSGFAAGERYLNRVWSASTDGYVDEVRQYLGRALEQFRESQAHFRELQQQHA